MKTIWIYVLAGVCSYLLAGVNPSILLSRAIYHQDIRTLGSGNPGFTNFKRVFGGRYAWYVFALDILKNLVLCLVFCPLFARVTGYYHLGAAYVGLCAMLGHAFPVWYRFKGGKGFLVGATAIWFIDWRTALAAAVLWGLLLATTKYMSLSVILAAASCPVMLLCLGTRPIATTILCAAGSTLMIVRHHENIRRLCQGTESKFRLFGKKPRGENAESAEA